MPVKLGAVISEVKQSSIKVMVGDQEQELEFKFKPASYTPKLEREMSEARDSPLAGPMLIGMLVVVLDWIDLELPNGKPCTITEEDLEQVPFAVLSEVMTKINEEMDPGKKKKPASGGSFSASNG